MNGNDFVKMLLKSPLHGLVGNTMLVIVTGRRTGRRIEVPVNYYCEADTLWVSTRRSRNWWRNIGPRAEIGLRLNGKQVQACAETILDPSEVAAHILEYVRHLPMAARALGVRLASGVSDPGDAARAAQDRLFVKVTLLP